MLFSAALHDRRVLLMTGLALASGILVSFTYQLEPLWRELSVGVVFGVVVAAHLFHLGLADPLKGVGFAVLAVAAWWLAERAAIQVFGWFDGADFLTWPGLAAGLAGGVVGALLLALATALLFPAFRRPDAVVPTVVVGGVLGALFCLIDLVDSGLVLFPPWQAAVAFCLGRGLLRPAGEAVSAP